MRKDVAGCMAEKRFCGEGMWEMGYREKDMEA